MEILVLKEEELSLFQNYLAGLDGRGDDESEDGYYDYYDDAVARYLSDFSKVKEQYIDFLVTEDGVLMLGRPYELSDIVCNNVLVRGGK